jgi:hypothetical protein
MRHSIQSNFLEQKEDNLLEDYLESMLQYNKAKLLQKTKSLEQKRNESIDSFLKKYFKKFYDSIKLPFIVMIASIKYKLIRQIKT